MVGENEKRVIINEVGPKEVTAADIRCDSDIEIFNQKLAELCETHQIKYLDAYTNFSSLDLSKIYMDAVHLNKVGQQELAMVYRKIV